MTDLGGGRESLPCFKCGKAMRRAMDGGYLLQPDDGLHFDTQGAYGTTVFDPMDCSTLNIIICDECIVAGAREGLVYLGQPRVGINDEDGVAVGYYHPERDEVPWDPDKDYPPQEPVSFSFEDIVEFKIPSRAMLKVDGIRRAHERLGDDR